MGRRHEREVVNWVRDLDEGDAIRMPDSGSGTSHELPDVILTHQSGYYAGEVKYSNRDKIQVSPDEIENLVKFGRTWDFTPAIIVRFSQDTTFYVIVVGGNEYQNMVSESGWLYPKRDNRKQIPKLYGKLLGGDETNVGSETQKNVA